jgi:hypothetical protein
VRALPLAVDRRLRIQSQNRNQPHEAICIAYRMGTTLLTALVFAVGSLLSFASAQSEAPGQSGTEKRFRWSRSKSVVIGRARTMPAAGDRETTGDWFGRDGFCGWIHYYQQSRGGWCTAEGSHPDARYCELVPYHTSLAHRQRAYEAS